MLKSHTIPSSEATPTPTQIQNSKPQPLQRTAYQRQLSKNMRSQDTSPFFPPHPVLSCLSLPTHQRNERHILKVDALYAPGAQNVPVKRAP